METDFEIRFLDHVAIRVKDMDQSVQWYKSVFGFKIYKFKEWGDFPVFLLKGKTGIALFPAKLNDPDINLKSKNVKIDHFAFNVTNENFEKAKKKLTKLNIEFEQQNHHFFESLYFKDPDDHIVEITTILIPEYEFYQ